MRTKARIFAAAAQLFPRKGLDATRVEDIARRARVNKQRIYAYFGSKKNLYRQVLIDVYSRAAASKRLMALDVADIPRMTGVIIDTFFEVHETNPAFWRLLCWENLNGGRSLSPADWAAIRSVYSGHLERLYVLGQKRGLLRGDIDFSTYLMLLFSATYFYFSNQLTLSRLLRLELSSDAVRQRIEQQLQSIVADGVHVKASSEFGGAGAPQRLAVVGQRG